MVLIDLLLLLFIPEDPVNRVNTNPWRAGLPGRMSSDEYHGPPEGTTGKGTAKIAAPHDPADGASTVRPISTARKRPTIGQTQKLLLAALRLWELKNGYRR